MTFKYIRQFQKGNQTAYRQVFKELYSSMCSFAKKFIKDSDDSEDIVQEVFIELWNQHEKFESFDQIKAFLYLSVKNRCINYLKHHKVKEIYSKSTKNLESEFTDHLIATETVSQIKIAIDRLSVQRKEIILQSMKGLKNHEIAENLNISVNTVKMQKKIAYQQLRETLKDN